MPDLLRGLIRLPQQLLLGLVRGYRLLLKPWLGNACRFEPTCSAYALEALQRHGAVGGSLLGGWRLLRCQPWCQGGCDPVPEHSSLSVTGLFTRLGLVAEVRGPVTPDPTAQPELPPTRNCP